MNKHCSSSLTSLLLPFVLAVCNLQADTFTVTRTSSSGLGSLPVVIAQANATPGGQTIDFAVAGTITLASPLPVITNNLTINGGAGNAVVISGGGTVSIFSFAAGTTNFLNRLTLANGKTVSGGGAAINNSGALYVTDCQITNNSAPNGSGGAINNAGSLTVVSSTLSGNQATNGGAVYNSGLLTVNNSIFQSNQATNGNGGAVCNPGNLNVSHSWLFDNRAGNGGAFWNSGTIFMTTLSISNNQATFGFGGAIFSGGSLSITSSTLVGNSATAQNGIDGNFVLNNYAGGGGGGGAGLGGGIFIMNGSVSATNCTIAGNLVRGGDGGQFCCGNGSGGSGGGNNSGKSGYNGGFGGGGGGGGASVRSGGAGGYGGGGGGGAGGQLGIRVPGAGGLGGFGSGNGGVGSYGGDSGGGGGGAGIGAAIFMNQGFLQFVNCTVTKNTANGGNGTAGGVSGGTAGQGIGGGIYNYTGTVSLLNTIVAGNSSANSSPDLYGAFTSSGFNLIGNNQGATGLSINDFQNEVANLGPLQDNGGPTLTCALSQGSLAIGSGTSVGAPTTDQRGLTRPPGHIDIGAFQVVTVITPTITWSIPADITYGTTLGSGQLNASAGVDGTLTYAPPSGTLLAAGPNQVLTVVFTPVDLSQYAKVTNSVTINVLKANQTISFATISNKQIGDAPILLSGSASSGLPLTFGLVSGPASLTGNLLTLGSVSGLVTVRATQLGDANFNAAPYVDRQFALGVLPLPLITTQPISHVASPGDRVSFSVVANNGPLTYQWWFAGAAVPGESSPDLVLNRVKASQAGPYCVRVSNSSGSVTSFVATLTVTVAAGSPVILSQPQSQKMRVGENATFTVVASGSAPSVTFQWYRGPSGDTNGLILGATNAIYTALALTTNTSFWVTVRNSFGVVDSDSAVVTMFPANAAKLRVQMFSTMPGLTIDGPIGTSYRIEYKTNMTATSWTKLIDMALPSNPFTFFDSGAINTPARFYRVVAP